MNTRILQVGSLLLTTMLLSSCSTSASHVSAVPDGACDKVAHYDLPAQRFDETAQQLAHATGCFIRTDLENTGSVTVSPVKGEMSIRQALEAALRGTQLSITASQPDTLTVY